MNEKTLRVLEFNKIKEKIKAFTETGAGKEIVDNLNPYSSMYEVKMHLKETEEALKLLEKKGSAPFDGVYDVRNAISLVSKRAMLLPAELLRIGMMLRCARRFKDYVTVKDGEEDFKYISELCEGIVPFKKLEEDILNTILSEDEINDKASEALFSIRKTLRDKNASVKDKVNSLIRTYSKYLQDNLYSIRGDRYVIPVKSEYKNVVSGIIHDQSTTGATLFIEPTSLVNLNNEIRELMLKEKAEIERILSELSKRIYDNIIGVENNANIVWELDFIFAKAKYCSSIGGILPEVNDEGFIDIVQGRHPLIDSKNVVPLDIYFGKNYSTLVITGPNTGGKTVTLKTIGLISVMGLSGLLIPARENSKICYFREIYADIGDEQSIEQSLSTFSSHMKNIVNIINNSDKQSLVLFDELGAGTDPVEGAALAVSILEYFKEKEIRTVATTHYSELKVYAMRTEKVENASVEFDVETLKPTYRLLIGIPGKSNAFLISEKLGLPSFIIESAKTNISSDSLKFEDLIQSLQTKNIAAERVLRENEALKVKSMKLKEDYEKKLNSIENSKENTINEAQRKARLIIKETKEETDEILKNIRKLESMGITNDVRKKLEDERKKLNDKMDKLQDKRNTQSNQGETLKKVNIGDEVFLSDFNEKVTVLSPMDSKGDVQVQAGIMKINVNIKKLVKLKDNHETSKSKVKREINLNFKGVSSSVDLRGMDSEEGIYTTEKYIDDAYLGGLKEVMIIHGKGTGVLRQRISDMLRSNVHVKSYRLGEYGEGGTGVTVVTLK